MSNQNSLGYMRQPINASSVDVSSSVSYPVFQMPTFAPSSIPKPPTNSFTAFYDSSNSNRLSKKRDRKSTRLNSSHRL